MLLKLVVGEKIASIVNTTRQQITGDVCGCVTIQNRTFEL